MASKKSKAPAPATRPIAVLINSHLSK